MDRHELNMRGSDVGWVWAFSGHISLSCRSTDFSTWADFKKWLFDPEFGLERSQLVYPAGAKSVEVPIFWPHAALRLLGLDVAIGLCIRPPISSHLMEQN